MRRINSFRLAFLQLWNRRWRLLVQWKMVMLGFALVSGFFTLQSVANDQLVKDIGPIDQVWTAKGSPLNGLLANVYHMEAPLGNISLQEVEEWMQNPLVERATKISYGDTYNGRRILGAESNWKDIYELDLFEGSWPSQPMEIALSEALARELDIKMGTRFKGAHGEVVDEHQHDEEYTVVGIYKSSKTVADRILLTPLESVWHVHHIPMEQREITAVLVQTSSPMAMFQLPRQINSKSTFQAILPSIEVNRIYSLIGNTQIAFIILSALFLLLGGLSMAITLYETIRSQQFDHTLLRIFGLSPARLGGTIFLQAAMLLTSAWLIGIGFIKALQWLLAPYLSFKYGLSLSDVTLNPIDGIMLAIAMGISILITMPVNLRIYRMSIHKNLKNA